MNSEPQQSLANCFNGLSKVDSLGEAWRHECEARYCAAMPDNLRRRAFLDGVEAKRGASAAERLRRDVWVLMKAVE